MKRDVTELFDPKLVEETKAEQQAQVLTPAFWAAGLLKNDKTNKPRKCLANVMHVLSIHPAWQQILAWDEFGQCVITQGKPPMRDQDAPSNYRPGDWTDDDSARTVAWFAQEADFEPGIVQVDHAVSAIARRNVVHPVRDWLASLEWDGVERLSEFGSRYLGAAPSKYVSAVGRKWMIAAVARVFQPGCKVDSLLGLEGEQGIGKSSALRLLAGGDWFADTGITIGDKDSYQALRRKWIYEFSEMASIRGRDIERVKSFISSQVDTYRASYGRRTQDHPRQVVFAGSTNESEYLNDPTGARRFWPVRCGKVDLAGLGRDREQLWAEARTAYEAGEAWYLDTAELRAAAAVEQESRAEVDDWIDIVQAWLKEPRVPVGHGNERTPVDPDEGLTTTMVLLGAIGLEAARITLSSSQRAARVLRAIGFKHRRQVRLTKDEQTERSANDGKRSPDREWRFYTSPVPGSSDAGGDANDGPSGADVFMSPMSPYDSYRHEREGDRVGSDSLSGYRENLGDDRDRETTAESGSSERHRPDGVPSAKEASDSDTYEEEERVAIQSESGFHWVSPLIGEGR